MQPTDDAFTHPFQYWVGMETDPRTTPEALAEFNRFYSEVHVHEVIGAHPGFVGVSRYELVEPDPREGARPAPRWLAVYEMQDEAAAERYLKDNARPWLHRQKYSPWPAARRKAKTTWRMLWRKASSTGAMDSATESIFVVGMDVPPDTDADALAEFNAFYTHTHVPEVLAYGGYGRGTRFELYRDLGGKETLRSPRFCAIYEADAAATEARAARSGGRPEFSSGPPAWEQHELVWRLVYRRIPMPPEQD